MERYIKVDWPDSQYFMEDGYSDEVYWYNTTVFVTENLYHKVMNNDN